MVKDGSWEAAERVRAAGSADRPAVGSSALRQHNDSGTGFPSPAGRPGPFHSHTDAVTQGPSCPRLP